MKLTITNFFLFSQIAIVELGTKQEWKPVLRKLGQVLFAVSPDPSMTDYEACVKICTLKGHFVNTYLSLNKAGSKKSRKETPPTVANARALQRLSLLFMGGFVFNKFQKMPEDSVYSSKPRYIDSKHFIDKLTSHGNKTALQGLGYDIALRNFIKASTGSLKLNEKIIRDNKEAEIAQKYLSELQLHLNRTDSDLRKYKRDTDTDLRKYNLEMRNYKLEMANIKNELRNARKRNIDLKKQINELQIQMRKDTLQEENPYEENDKDEEEEDDEADDESNDPNPSGNEKTEDDEEANAEDEEANEEDDEEDDAVPEDNENEEAEEFENESEEENEYGSQDVQQDIASEQGEEENEFSD